MRSPSISQELTDAATSMEMAREAANRGDSAMMSTALKDVRKRVSRILKAIDAERRTSAIDPDLPAEPALPIRGE
jgi:hypothetical protein